MLNSKKRISKCIHYYLNNNSFKKIFGVGSYSYVSMKTDIKQYFSDLDISWQEVRAFYLGVSKNTNEFNWMNLTSTENEFYFAGLKI